MQYVLEILRFVSSLRLYAARELHTGKVLVWKSLRSAIGECQHGCCCCLFQGLTGEPECSLCVAHKIKKRAHKTKKSLLWQRSGERGLRDKSCKSPSWLSFHILQGCCVRAFPSHGGCMFHSCPMNKNSLADHLLCTS